MTPEEWAKHPLALAMPEKNLQSLVMGMLRVYGWRAFHAQISYGSQAGFPDVAAVRDGVLLFAELKRQRGKVTLAQEQWLGDLRRVPGALVHVWRPSDHLAGLIEPVLR